jgi:hypothetical protein
MYSYQYYGKGNIDEKYRPVFFVRIAEDKYVHSYKEEKGG